MKWDYTLLAIVTNAQQFNENELFEKDKSIKSENK